ncbi:MAG: ATP-dependent DNA helicase RecG [Lachnospiraceae bacterium]|jgi:ATP-dependent DNA helicase RecG|nr:ATP-dependent DNA helicase RecG [Lachnospiraceae bacterium]
MTLNDPINKLKGVGTKTADLFSKLKVNTIEDVLSLVPRGYSNYDEPVDINDATFGSRVAIEAVVQSYVEVKKVRKLTLVTCIVKDFTGSVKLVWFNSPFLKNVFHIGQTYVFVGTISLRKGQLTMDHPEYYTRQQYETLTSTLWPIYPLTEGLSNKTVTKVVKSALVLVDDMKETLPEQIISQYKLMPRKEAIRGVHFPENREAVMECRKRLIFDEFFFFIARMRRVREKTIKAQNRYCINDFSLAKGFIENLPFELTKGQQEAVDNIWQDISGDTVMNRLIQGDVGSGKTAVAEIAILSVVGSGYQAAFMAPTEVLATQHYMTLLRDFENYNIKVALLVGSTKLSEKRKIYESLAAGEIDVIVGTHALIQDKVVYNNLALVITDEQHRFGVRQRTVLAQKGEEPHVIVMSATPIPRTLAIIMYGDLDISVMKDMPSNRKPIKNCVVGPKYRPTAYRFMGEQIEMGHQIYIICPMIEAGENVEAENVIDYAEQLEEYFGNKAKVVYLHGKMSAQEKNMIMDDFAEKKTDILVSTTVIEVGIDNPNATVMMIENAEKYGLAQLHQLRGRVGRGDAQSYCIFLCSSDSKQAKDRLEILNKSNDGFHIANEDLKLRGPGEFFGVRQSGEVLFELGDIYNNADILKMANEAVDYAIQNDCDINLPEVDEIGISL